MPNLIKIGYANGEDVKKRMSELYTTGVPVPFECVYAARVKDCAQVEKALHKAFGPNRLNPRREFFEIEAVQAMVIIQLLELEDVTPKVQAEKETVDQIDREAGEAYERKRRPRFNFKTMGIPIGSTLVSLINGETVTVLDERMVEFKGKESTLTNATRVLLDGPYNVAPGPYWTYNGKKLREIYDETY